MEYTVGFRSQRLISGFHKKPKWPFRYRIVEFRNSLEHCPAELRKAVDSPVMLAKDLVEPGANAVEGRLELLLQLPRMRKLLSCELIRKELPVAEKLLREGNRADWYTLPLIVQILLKFLDMLPPGGMMMSPL
jgi:hypothetical protein